MRAVTPRRSVLYMPGSNARALEKARTLDADGFIFDLEDSVAPDRKGMARSQVVESVRAGGYRERELVIRVNALDTPWGLGDLQESASSGCHAVLIPKVDRASDIHEVEQVLVSSGAPKELRLWCMMETPRGVLRAEEIADSTDRLECLVLGTSDLAKDLSAQHTAERLPLITSLGLCLLAGRASGLSVIDGVFLDLQDEPGFRASCEQGKRLGFDGKTLIHPKTIAIANEVFAPTEEELDYARRVVEAHALATEEGKGIVVLDGRLIENLHVDAAQSLLARAEAINALAQAN